jgi:hypothetical protein
MNDVFLLGAGASMDAGLPSSFQLTELISRSSALPEPGRRGGVRELATALAFAVGTLYQQRGAAGINPLHKPGIDIEELIDAVDALAHPELSGMTPFISGFHPFLRDVDAAADDRGSFVDEFVNQLDGWRRVGGPLSLDAKEFAGASLKMALMLSQPKFASVLFRRLRAAIVMRASQVLWMKQATADKVSYLSPLLTSSGVRSIATLNYDNAIEICAGCHDVPLDFGLSRYESHGEVTFSGNGKRVIKLHGSMDWSLADDSGTQRKFTGAECLRFSWKRIPPTNTAWKVDDLGIVFGRFKMLPFGPFLDLLKCYVDELRGADRLITVGYSYRDGHVNRAITQFLHARGHAKLLLIDPGLPQPYDPVVALLQRFPERVRVWNTTAARALESYPDGMDWQK